MLYCLVNLESNYTMIEKQQIIIALDERIARYLHISGGSILLSVANV